MCARVAQWWSIALPRRGSRVRIPSRALKEIEKRVIQWMALFSMFEPCRARTVRSLRSAPVVAGERPPDVLRRLVLSKKCEKEEISDGYLFFCMFDPAGLERFEVYAPLRSLQQFQILVKHKIAWYDKICSEMLVDGINPILLMTHRKVGSLLTS